MEALTDAALVTLGLALGYAIFLDTGLTLTPITFVAIGVLLAVWL